MKRPERPHKTRAVDDQRLLSMVKSFHNIQPREENSPGDIHVTVIVYNQETTSWEQYRGFNTRCNKARFYFAKKHLKKLEFWVDETKINLYQNDGKTKVWRRLGTDHEAYNIICETWWSSVMAWACMASSGTGLLVFSDDVTRGQKHPGEFWSVQGYTLCPDSAKCKCKSWLGGAS